MGTRSSHRFYDGNHSTSPNVPISTPQQKLSTDEDTNGVNMKGLSSPNDKTISVVAPPKKSEKTKAKFAALTIDPSRKPATATLTTKRSYLSSNSSSVRKSILEHYDYTLARRRYKMDAVSVYEACALSLRDRLVERWSDTQQFYASSEECKDLKMVYYMSMEF